MKSLHFALIGENIEYSLSPRIFEAIFKQLRVEGQFEVHSFHAAELPSRLRQMSLDGITGVSITIPHKQAVIPHLDDIGPIANAVQAVNSIVVQDGQLYGYNTDCFGLSYGLRPHRARLGGGAAVIVGSGGAARAAIQALHKDFSIHRFLIAGRTPEKATATVEQMQTALSGTAITTISLGDVVSMMKDASLVVNCTPLGGPNYVDKSPFPSGLDFRNVKLYYDLNYNTGNKLVAAARGAGIIALDGSAMLVAQALRSFDIWTGQTVDFDPVYEATFGKPVSRQ